MSLANLAAEIKLFVSGNRLVELTNPDNPSATTVNDTVLEQACKAATGDFLIYAKTRPLTDAPMPPVMFSILYKGVLAHLHQANMRNDVITESLRRDFQMSCKQFKTILGVAAFGTSQTLLDEARVEKSPFSPDRRVMQGGERSRNIENLPGGFGEYLT